MFGKARSVSGSLAARVAHNAIPRRAAGTTTTAHLLEEARTSAKLGTLPLSSPQRQLEGKLRCERKGLVPDYAAADELTLSLSIYLCMCLLREGLSQQILIVFGHNKHAA